MKLALTTSTYGSVDLYEAIRRIRDYGYDAIEITAVPGQHIAADRFSSEERERFRGALDEIGLSVSAITSGPCPPRATEEELGYVRSSIDLAAALGAKVAITYVTKNEAAADMGEREWRGDVSQRLASLADYADERRVRLALETEPGFLIDRPQDGIALVREIDHPALRYNLCVPHILPAIGPGETILDIVDLAADLIVNTHLADVKDRVHKHLVPGEGDVDFEALFARLREIGYDGYLTFDLYPYAERSDYAAEHTMNFLRQLMPL